LTEPLRIYVGWDRAETVSYAVLCHSIIQRSSIPVSITPVKREHLREFKRVRSEKESTDFSISRFLVPYLAGYTGLALFMDCDMLCLADIAELLEIQQEQPYAGVLVCQHDYTPKGRTKFLGNIQTVYPRKNWSSFILFNLQNWRCKDLTAKYVNEATGLELHRFEWIQDERIGKLPLEWNHLVGEYKPNPKAKMLHFTLGGPWFEEFSDCEGADLWRAEFAEMTAQKVLVA
jgi:lipopolysaccharide biosynthesis glycosyltransferase